MHMMIYLNKLVADGHLAFNEIIVLTPESSTIIIGGITMRIRRQDYKGVKSALFLISDTNVVLAIGNKKIVKFVDDIRKTMHKINLL